MNNPYNLNIYRIWAPIYDALFTRIFDRPRRRTIELLNMQPGERLLITGIGTGLDLPHLPANVSVVGIDFSPAMLDKARLKVGDQDVTLLEMDAQTLEFPDASFDAVLLNLILSVVPDCAAAFRETWRVMRVGGRAVIFDKFLAEDAEANRFRRLVGSLTRILGTDPNRRLSEVIGGVPRVAIVRDEPSLFRGRYRILKLRKGEPR